MSISSSNPLMGHAHNITQPLPQLSDAKQQEINDSKPKQRQLETKVPYIHASLCLAANLLFLKGEGYHESGIREA